jgi:hypothetical protein
MCCDKANNDSMTQYIPGLRMRASQKIEQLQCSPNLKIVVEVL